MIDAGVAGRLCARSPSRTIGSTLSASDERRELPRELCKRSQVSDVALEVGLVGDCELV